MGPQCKVWLKHVFICISKKLNNLKLNKYPIRTVDIYIQNKTMIYRDTLCKKCKTELYGMNNGVAYCTYPIMFMIYILFIYMPTKNMQILYNRMK